MEEGVPLIYGLEFKARSLAPLNTESEVTKFLVGTQSLKAESNEVHLVELNEDTGELYGKVFPHKRGEVWHLHWSPHNASQFVSSYKYLSESFDIESNATVWSIVEGEPGCEGALEEVCSVYKPDLGNIKTASFHPSKCELMLSVGENKFNIWDLGKGAPVTILSVPAESKGSAKFYLGKWNPTESGAQVAIIQDSTVKGWDTRQNKHTWALDQAHMHLVRDVDYNLSRGWTVGTCGDDCDARVWDLRSPSSPTHTLSLHTHWVWSLRFNLCHELLLTSSSDSTVRVSSLAPSRPSPLIASFEHAEDSVYVSEWSSYDPWTVASLSYDGRLIIDRIPKQQKYMIIGI